MANEQKKTSHVRKWLMIILILILIGVLFFAGMMGFVYYQETHVAPVEKYDAIIVLGAQVLPSGEPNVQLEWRLEAALEAYTKAPKLIVTCGAQGDDEPRPEADVMRDWLIDRGVDPEQVLAENTSFNTRQNIENAMALLEGYEVNTVLIVTSDYHLPRALAIARDAGVNSTGIGSPCKPEYWLKNHLRESLSWLKYWGEKYLGLSF